MMERFCCSILTRSFDTEESVREDLVSGLKLGLGHIILWTVCADWNPPDDATLWAHHMTLRFEVAALAWENNSMNTSDSGGCVMGLWWTPWMTDSLTYFFLTSVDKCLLHDLKRFVLTDMVRSVRSLLYCKCTSSYSREKLQHVIWSEVTTSEPPAATWSTIISQSCFWRADCSCCPATSSACTVCATSYASDSAQLKDEGWIHTFFYTNDKDLKCFECSEE